MQRKILSTKKVRFGAYAQNGQEKLHSIPILNTNNSNKYMKKHNVLYSISCGCVFLLLGMSCSLALSSLLSYSCSAITSDKAAIDSGTISPVTGSTAPTPTASLTLSNDDMKSTPTAPGDIATTSTDVTVDIKNASSYSLTLNFEKVDLTNGNTTITAGDPNSQDNVWGYTWDNASTYTTPAASGNTLIPTTNLSSDTTFTKTLAFGAKFANNADPGEYKTRGTLSLAVSPKAATIITLDNLTQMQQLAPDYAPDACKNTEIPAGKDYAGPYSLTDVRDNNKYTVYKFKDGKCWMTENLKLSNIVGSNTFGGGRTLNSATSDISADTWTLPASNTSGFTDNTVANTYYNPVNATAGAKNTGYYTWCAVTAGCKNKAGNNPGVVSGDTDMEAASSICPKGWKLPSGGRNYTNTSEYYDLIIKGIFNNNSSFASAVSGNNYFSDSDASNTLRGTPYNFAYTGYMGSSRGPQDTGHSYWWSRTAYSSNNAYALYIDSSNVYPGTRNYARYDGFAVRCVAE